MPIVKNNKNYGTIVKLMGEGPDPVLEHIDITANGDYTPREGTDGWNSIHVDVPIPEPILGHIDITSNGDYTPREGTDGWNSIHVDVPTSGDPSLIRSLIDKSIETYEDPELQVIGQYAFRNCSALRTLNCPKVRRVEEFALDGAGYNWDGTEVTLDWDNLEYLGHRSLAGMKNDSFVTSAPVVISNTGVFYEANIVNFDAPNARLEHNGDTRELFSRTNLVNTDGVKNLFRGHRLEHTFTECHDLVNVDLENIYHIGDSVFRWCNNLETVRIATRPTYGAEWLYDNVFGDCSSLKTVVIEGVVSNFGNGVFSGCSSLESFTLTNSAAVRNMYQYGKSADEFFGYGCNPNVNIYVPADIVDSLKEAWGDRADHIFSIS